VTDVEQAARVQLLYRQVNEQIHSVGRDVFDIPPDEALSVVCECLNLGCVDRIQIAARELQRVRSSAAQFVVVPGHEDEAIEAVVERRSSFFVVAKDAAVIERLQ
jgi:hypothetical protein